MRKTTMAAGMLFVAVFLATGRPTVQAQAPADQAAEIHVIINKGDTLSKIGRAHGTTYIRLFDANPHIKDPDIIYPGDKLRIPRPDEVLASRVQPAEVPAAANLPARPPVRKQQQPAALPQVSVNGGIWDRLAACESGGNWSINTGNGYYGGLQFSLSSWRAVGGSGYPHQASKAEQIRRAEMLKARQGWGAWPACSRKLGLR